MKGSKLSVILLLLGILFVSLFFSMNVISEGFGPRPYQRPKPLAPQQNKPRKGPALVPTFNNRDLRQLDRLANKGLGILGNSVSETLERYKK